MSDLGQEPLFFPGDAIHQVRVDRVAAALRRHDLDGLLLLKHDAVRYVTGFYAKGYRPFIDFDYAALVRRDRDITLGYTVGGEERRIALRSRVAHSFRLPSFTRWGAGLGEMLRRSGVTTGRLGFDLLPHFIHEELRAAFPILELVDASGLWADLTAIKHPLEIPMIEQALRIAEAGAASALEAIRPGVTEIEVSAAAEQTMRAMGSEMNPFIPVVASGANAAIWERVATHRMLETGEMVILDFGSVFNGYTGDFARTTIVGEPTAAQRALYRAAYDGLTAAIDAVRPGVLCSEIDRIGRGVIADAGFATYAQPWAMGNQLGFGLHGEPVLGPGVDVPLQAGMVINIEPSLYTFDDLAIGGVELEDTVLVTDTGSRRLTNFPYEPRLLA
jgi:Xaa-Pro aminopeptidase